MADPPGAGGGRFDYTYLDPSSDPLALPADRPFSSTDPTSALQYRQRVNKNRRRHTTLEEEPYEEQSGQQLPENDAQFRQEVFNTIKSRLREEGIHAQDLGERFFGWCLPKYGASRQDWSRLLHHSLFLPNEKLETLLSLEKVGQATRVDKEKLTLFYIRTFALTISELAGVELFALVRGCLAVFRWMEVLKPPMMLSFGLAWRVNRKSWSSQLRFAWSRSNADWILLAGESRIASLQQYHLEFHTTMFLS